MIATPADREAYYGITGVDYERVVARFEWESSFKRFSEAIRELKANQEKIESKERFLYIPVYKMDPLLDYRVTGVRFTPIKLINLILVLKKMIPQKIFSRWISHRIRRKNGL